MTNLINVIAEIDDDELSHSKTTRGMTGSITTIVINGGKVAAWLQYSNNQEMLGSKLSLRGGLVK